MPDRIEWIGVTSLYDVHTHKTLCIHKVHNKQLFRKNVRSERQDNIITIRFPLGLLFEILATVQRTLWLHLWRLQKSVICLQLGMSDERSARWVTDMGLLKYLDVFLPH